MSFWNESNGSTYVAEHVTSSLIIVCHHYDYKSLYPYDLVERFHILRSFLVSLNITMEISRSSVPRSSLRHNYHYLQRHALQAATAVVCCLCLQGRNSDSRVSAFLLVEPQHQHQVSALSSSSISPFSLSLNFPTLGVRGSGRVRDVQSSFTAPLVAFATANGYDDVNSDDDDDDSDATAATQQTVTVEGFTLLSEREFQRLQAIHETMQELRQEIPALLTRPLTDASAAAAYTEQTRLLVADTDDFELASSRTELMALSTTLVLATEASVRASNFLSNPTSLLGGGGGDSKKNATQSTSSSSPVVKCRILVDADMKAIRVEWQSKVLSLLGSSTPTETSDIQGISMLLLDPVTGKIATHRLLQVKWRGKDQDSQAIGQALSTLRRTYLNLRESPFLQPFFSESSPLSQVREELMQQLSVLSTSSSSATKLSEQLAPLYVTPSLKDVNSDASKDGNTSSVDLVPIDEWTPRTRNQPQTTATTKPKSRTSPVLPGSHLWMRYAVVHRSIVQFMDQIIPSLSNDPDISSTTIKSYFTPKAQLVALDGSLILQDASRMTNFYQSIAAWRRRSFASWTLDKAVVLEWKSGKQLRIRIDYTTTINLPGAGSDATSICGSDIYVLAIDPRSVDNGMVRIEQVLQQELSIGGNKNKQDGVWFMRSIATAVETGLFSNNEESVLLDLVQRSMNANGKGRPGKQLQSASTSEMELIIQPPLLSDVAAANVYRIMATLHRDLPKLLDDSTSSDSLLPPCHEYMADSMELHGYLGEVLLRGRTAYNRSVGLLVASLRAALRTGRVQAEQSKPSVQVELTTKGNVRLSMTLYLKILPIPGGFPGLDSNVLLQTSLPLKIDLVSDYVIDADTGLIVQHELIESRVNGQLTPADIVSQWIRQRQVPMMGGASTSSRGGGSSSFKYNAAEESWMQTALDTVNWVRSLNKSSS
jgi:hypothetical protein